MKRLILVPILVTALFVGGCGGGKSVEGEIVEDIAVRTDDERSTDSAVESLERREAPDELRSRKQEGSVGEYWEDVIKKQSEQAKYIVHGRVMDVSSKRGRNEYGDEYVSSEIILEVMSNLKGEKADIGRRILFTSLGGVIGNLVYSYSITPLFNEGKEVIVFLDDIDGKYVVPVGWEAPKLTVDAKGFVTPSSMTISAIKEIIALRNGGAR